MIDFTLRLVQCFMNYFIIYLFVDGIFKKREKSILIRIICLSVTALLQTAINGYENPVWNTVGMLAILSILLFLLFKETIIKVGFAAIILVAILIGCEFICVAGISAIGNVSVWETAEKTLKRAGESFISTTLFFVIITCSKLLFFKSEKTNRKNQIHFSVGLMCLPILSVFIAYFIVQLTAQLPFNKTILLKSIFLIFCLLVANIIVFATDSDARKKQQYKAQILEMQTQGELKEALILQQDIYFKEVNNLVHDFKHHLTTMQMEVNEIRSDDARNRVSNQIDAVMDTLPRKMKYSDVKNNALRCILLHSQHECEKYGIKFTAEIEFSDFDFLKYQDVCAIFSNILDNAICACVEMRNKSLETSITVKTKAHNNMAFVEVCNTKINLIYEDDGLICTTKSDKKRHGIGLSNVRRTVETNGGNTSISYSDDTFKVNLVFWINKPSKCI